LFNTNDIKNGITFMFEDNIYQVLDFLHVKPGKGAAFVKAKIKNLRTGSIVEKTFNTSIKLEKAMIEKKAMQYLYSSGDTYYFMNMESYEQVEIDKTHLGDDALFLKENGEVFITFFKGEILGVLLPDKVTLTVTKTEPAVKGNTTNNATKDAILETGLSVKVPLFVEEGTSIIVSTSDGKYVSRA